MRNKIFEVPAINFDNSEALLNNPDRGLRMEAYITLGEKLSSYPNDNKNPYDIIENLIKKYDVDSPKLCQLYVYLSNYNKKDLDLLAFNQLEKVFNLFRDSGIRLLLRFAYSTESVSDVPYRRVKKHLSQIKSWFDENSNLINSTLYCLQTGIIGYWGEGHSYKRLSYFDIPKVINSVCELAPNGIYTQVRFHKMFKKVKPKYINKVGFHDDYIVGDLNHKWSIAPVSNEKLFNNIMQRCKYTINDGEMPWGYAHYNDNPNDILCDDLNGIDILKQISIYHLTSFSLEHNYREKGGSYSMVKWKNTMLSYDDVKNLGVVVNPFLFKNSKNEDIKLSVYDIIRYHLGYQLMITNCKCIDNEFLFSMTNYGFSAPLNFNYLAVVTINNSEKREIEVESFDKNKLQSGATINYKIKLCENDKIIGIKMDTFKNRGININFANSNVSENGIMLL